MMVAGKSDVASAVKRSDYLPLRHPVGRQRVPLKPKQAHTPGLLPGQNALDDGGLQQRQAQQLVDRGVVQAFALGDFTAAVHHPIVEQLLPMNRLSPGRRWYQLTAKAGDFGSSRVSPR